MRIRQLHQEVHAMAEVDLIRERYAARADSNVGDRYSVLNNDALLGMGYVDSAIVRMLKMNGLTDFPNTTLLEVGCGSGGNLLRFLRWGFAPENLVGNELLDVRSAAARSVLPTATRVIGGDARNLSIEQFDIVYQATVFSSILDWEFQSELARHMWDLVKPGGALLSYDLAFNNPRNKDVRKVSRRRLRQLFPEGEAAFRRLTLAPPIARRVSASHAAYRAFNSVPLLRTHNLCFIQKKGGSVK